MKSYESIIVSAASTYDVDNDTSNSNYSNNSGRYTHYSGTWGSYLYSGYNGDARLRSSTTKGSYEWVWYGNHYGSKFKMEVWVYLANNNFTDTAAKYNIFQDSNMFTSAYSFYINQNIAPSGFTAKVKTKTTAITNGQLHPWYATVTNSGNSNVGTGADDFKIRITAQ